VPRRIRNTQRGLHRPDPDDLERIRRSQLLDDVSGAPQLGPETALTGDFLFFIQDSPNSFWHPTEGLLTWDVPGLKLQLGATFDFDSDNLRTTSRGIDVRQLLDTDITAGADIDGALRFLNATNDTVLATIEWPNDSHMEFHNYNRSRRTRFYCQDAADVQRNMLSLDAFKAELRVAGSLSNKPSLITTLEGIDIWGDIQNNPATGGDQDTLFQLLNGQGALAGSLGWNTGIDMSLTNFVRGGKFMGKTELAGGGQETSFQTDTAALGGLFANNQLTGAGLERVLTQSDVSTGGASFVAQYRFDTSIVEADPGNGDFRMDNATPASVTELFVSSTTDNSIDFNTMLSLVGVGDQVYIQQDNDATKFVLFDVTANVDNTGWWSLAGTPSSSGTIFDNNAKCHILILLGGSGAFGDVFKVGTPVQFEYAVWTGDGTLASSTELIQDQIGGLINVSDNPALTLQESDAAANNRNWTWQAYNEVFKLELYNDIFSSSSTVMEVQRTLNVADLVQFTATSFDIVGALTATSYGGILEANLLDKTAQETISDDWTFQTKTTHEEILLMHNAKYINWLTFAGVEVNMFTVHTDDVFYLGSQNYKTVLRGIEVDINSAVEIDINNDIDVNGNVNATTIGGIAIANLVDKSAGETITGLWIHDNELAITNANYLQFENNTGGLVNLFTLYSDNIFYLGSNGYIVNLRGANVRISTPGTISLQDNSEVTGGSYFDIRDGGIFRIRNSTDTDNVEFHHDGTDLNIDGLLTDAININLPLNVTDAFTSLGIDDNATTEVMEIADTTLSIGQNDANSYDIRRKTDTGLLTFSGGSTGDNGAAIWLYGGLMATNPGDMLLESDGEIWQEWDEAGGIWNLYTGTGVKTLGLSVAANQVASFANDILFTEAADHTGTPAAGNGHVWLRDDAPNNLIFTDDAGTDQVLNNKIIQIVDDLETSDIDGTTTIPDDDTIPQITEGFEVMTVAITPRNTAHRLRIEVVVNLAHQAFATTLVAALFQDSTADALAVAAHHQSASNRLSNVSFSFEMAAGTTSSTTFRVRIGATTAGTVTLNGTSVGRKYGGVLTSSITVTEFEI